MGYGRHSSIGGSVSTPITGSCDVMTLFGRVEVEHIEVSEDEEAEIS